MIINGRRYTFNQNEKQKKKEEILNAVSKFIIKQEEQKTLLNKLAKIEPLSCSMVEITEVLPLLLTSQTKEKETNEEIDTESKKEKRKRKREKCNITHTTPGILKNHLNKNEKCKQWREKAKKQ